jgi:tetratricopeptide (TPR) repeat protein
VRARPKQGVAWTVATLQPGLVKRSGYNRRVLRWLGFFALAVLFASVLGHLPLVGPLFRGTGIIGILLSAVILSAVVARVGARLFSRRKLRSELRVLGEVDKPHTRGKLGALLLAHGSARAAIPHLEEATRGEPEVAEWHYRLGLARRATREHAGALAAFEACVAREEEHAYGSAQLRRAEALLALGRGADSLAVLALFERNHGPSPESAYRRGLALRALGKKDEARRAFREVGELARKATRYQRRAAGVWALRAGLARIV